MKIYKGADLLLDSSTLVTKEDLERFTESLPEKLKDNVELILNLKEKTWWDYKYTYIGTITGDGDGLTTISSKDTLAFGDGHITYGKLNVSSCPDSIINKLSDLVFRTIYFKYGNSQYSFVVKSVDDWGLSTNDITLEVTTRGGEGVLPQSIVGKDLFIRDVVITYDY